MCNNKNSPPTKIPDLEGSSMISKESTTVISLRPARKTRTKTRKPKFLSLRLELSSDNSQESGETMARNHHQLNLFPLHPENLVEEKDMHDENMAYFFAASDGGATLNGLLGGDAGPGVPSEDSLSPSLSYAYGGKESEEGAITLVRTALRNRERDASEEEKWVCYSEVVEKKEEEVTSCAPDLWYKSNTQGLSLKLDYQEILNAWSGKGPLFVEGESPQTVPDLANDLANVMGEGWRVPEMGGRGSSSMKMGQRLASVLRYKEKRQSRLFSKRIRYEVRKLNAEKRPRMKGRFVKRS